MAHPKAPLTPEGRRRLCERIDAGASIASVAAGSGVSRQRLGVWYKRWVHEGEMGLEDVPSIPHNSPRRTPDWIEKRILEIRKEDQWGPAKIAGLLRLEGITIAGSTVHKVLVRNGVSRQWDLDPETGEIMRKTPAQRYEHEEPGDLIHIDVKKVQKVPEGGGWRIHGRGSEAALKAQQQANRVKGKTHLHAAVDDHSRIAYVECLENERAVTAVAFLDRALAFYATHGITVKAIITDNGSCYQKVWSARLRELGIKEKHTRRQRPQTNGKVERFNRTMKDEWLRKPFTSEAARRDALIPFLNGYNHDRPHLGINADVPMSRAPAPGPRLTPTTAIEPLPDQPGQMTFDDLLG